MLSDGFPQGKCRSQETIGGTAVMVHVYNEDETLKPAWFMSSLEMYLYQTLKDIE